MGIKFGTDASVKGMGPEKDFDVSVTKEVVIQDPISKLIQCYEAKNILLEGESIPQEVLKVTVSGNTADLKVYTSDPNYAKVSGDTVYKIKDFHPVLNPKYLFLENEFGKRKFRINIDTEMPVLRQKTTGTFVNGSLGKACTELLYSLVNGKVPGSNHQDLFLPGGTFPNTHGDPPTNIVRNPNRMIPKLDLSGVSITREADNGPGVQWRFPAILVSPRHFVCNKHCGVWTGLTVYFLTKSGVIHEATVLDSEDVAPESDLRVGIFTEDVPDCEYYGTLSGDWMHYIPGNWIQAKEPYSGFMGVPGVPLVTCQANPGEDPGSESGNNIINTDNRKLRITWMLDIWDAKYPPYKQTVALHGMKEDPMYPFFNQGYGGDSGSPIFMLVPYAYGNFVPALISSYWSSGGGPFYPLLRERINEAMQMFSTRHGDPRTFTMKTANLSRFTRFSPV